MGGQRHHDHDASGAGGDGKGERIKGLLKELFYVGIVAASRFRFFLLLMGVGGRLIEQRPSHRGQHEAARDFHDREGDAEEGEKSGSDELDDQQEEDGIDGDPAREAAIDLGRSGAYKSVKDECRAERIHQRQQRAEGNAKLAPDHANHAF